ncbi:hypothetical protein [Anaerostipes caccae]|uniref:hypothetical protein n=1 Tax=Anaerostipes caccae TaxID=105841 RepID=UPI0038D392DE
MNYDKCPICNEKLKNGICPMCGYDFKRLESGQRSGNRGKRPDYRVRPNEEPDHSMTKQHKQAHRQFRTEKKRGAGKLIKFILSFVVISSIFLDAVSEADIGQLMKKVRTFMSEDEKKQWTKTMPDDTYEAADYDLEKTGKRFSVNLTSGRYIVGLDLPEGNYTMTAGGEELYFSANNDAQNIGIYEEFTDEKILEVKRYCKVKNVRLYQGSLIEVTGRGHINCETSDANMKKMEEPRKNPLSKEVEVDGVMTAGKDFPAGTYDVVAVSDGGEFKFTYEQDKDDEFGANSIWLSEDSKGEDPEKFVNLELMKGTEIEIPPEGYFQVRLIPSKHVRPENMHVYDSLNGLDS